MALTTDITIMVVGLLLLLCALYIYIVITKAHNFRLRQFNGNRSTVTDYKMMEKRDKKDNTTYWVSVPWQKKIKVFSPPTECIDISNKGRKYLEAYQLTNDEFCFIKDDGYMAENDVVKDNWKPFTTTQRGVLVQQLEKAIEQRQKSLWRPEFIVPTVSVVMLAVVIIALFVFWGDIAQPALQSHNLALAVQKQNLEIARELDIKLSGGTAQTASEPLNIPLGDELEDILPLGR